MGDFDYLKFQEDRVLESWGIFKNTGDIFDAMELMEDFEMLDRLLKEDNRKLESLLKDENNKELE